MLAEGARQVEAGDITDAAVSDAAKYADCWHARRMAIGENAAYAEVAEFPALVRAAVLLAQARNFDHSCRPEQARLLAVVPERDCNNPVLADVMDRHRPCWGLRT